MTGKKLFENHEIFDEYGKELTPIEMLSVIIDRKAPEGKIYRPENSRNFERNPESGLLRTKIGNYNCVGHGPTYELNEGEFS